MLFRANDPAAVRQAEFMSLHPGVTQDAFVWTIRGIVIAGLNIIEILRREPALFAHWVIRLVPLDRLDERRTPTASDAPSLIEFFRERIYNLGCAVAVGAAPAEHRRILDTLARVASLRGELDQSEEYLQRARAMNAEQRDFVTEAGYLCNLGVVAAMRGQTNTARDYFAQALSLCKGDPNLGRLYVTTQVLSADEVERRRIEHERQMASGTVDTALQEDEIEVCNLLGEEFAHNTEITMKRAIRLKEIEGNAYGNLARIALSNGDIELARSEFSSSLAIHESIGHTDGTKITRDELSRLA